MKAGSTRLGHDPLSIILVSLLGFVFLLAALTKSIALEQFTSVVEHLSGTGRTVASGLSFVLVVWEVTLGSMLMMRLDLRRMLILSFLTITVFTGALIVLKVNPSGASCGCFGFAKSSMGPNEDTTIGLLRNAALLLVNGWLILSSRVFSGPQKGLVKESPSHRTATTGFTLVETLVVIAIIAVLVAIALPTLSKTRKQGKTTMSFATHQQLVAAINTYGADFKDALPFIGTVGNPMGPLVVNGYDLLSNAEGRLSFFRANSRVWLSLLYPAHLSSRKSISTDSNRESDEISGYPANVFTTGFFLTHGCSAYAQYWDADDAPIDETLIRGSLLSDVRFPSSKGLVFDADSGDYLNKPGPEGPKLFAVGRADGSAGTLDILNPPGDAPVNRPYGAIPFPVMSTRHGLAGRDF
jgi:prepilin-type N-terminal cleavage/methylation domain-containing protein